MLTPKTEADLLMAAKLMLKTLSAPGAYLALLPTMGDPETMSHDERAALRKEWKDDMEFFTSTIAKAESESDHPATIPTTNPCLDGHDGPTHELLDGNGIYCCRVCDRCEDFQRRKYRPEIMNAPYSEEAVCEAIEPD